MNANQRIALDVMGGDSAPACNLDGALLAAQHGLAPERLLLVGNEDVIRSGLEERGGNPGFDVLHAPEAIGMDEKPGVALRAKPQSSIAIATGAVKMGAAGAHVSMGNTGAVVGAATVGLKTLPGVRRPGIAVTLELTGEPVTILDMGANVVPKPEHLLQYGLMGAVLTRDVLRRGSDKAAEKPRVGLLNIGEEPSKGTDLLREAHGLLTESPLNFIGNIEGGDLFKGGVDVVVTDGFTGNVVLKLLEDYSGFMLNLVMRELKAHGAQWGPEALSNVRKRIDYSEYGGALLLGVNGIVVIGHGRSDATAVSNAINLAQRTLDADVNGHIVRGLEG
ncbi:Phosphate acyltransferase [Planctomycetes bacterium Poly30]|uniref:Phosphate acyltransferase n=1 Tax=Saltatorellus ferox TaxID=2528018 RepID=A0A518ET94_9BACT|nr:Phosphate acyltransferase [Planctomycetes bacterium Poly30]